MDGERVAQARRRPLVDARRIEEARELLEPRLPAHRSDLGRVYTVMGTIDRIRGDLPSAEKALHRAVLELSQVDAKKLEKKARAELEAVLAMTRR